MVSRALLLALAAFAPASAAAPFERARDVQGPAPVVPRERAQDSPPQPASLQAAKDDEARRSFLRGLDYLATQQASHQDGSFPRAGGAQHAPVALAALGALAFMAEGSTPQRGRYGREVALAVDYLLARADGQTSTARGYIAVSADDKWGMHAHGYAVLALCNAFTLSPAGERGKRIAALLPESIGVIERSQTSEGGWFYFPTAGLEHENSVTVVQLQALRAARNCGVKVNSSVVSKAVEYIHRCQSDDGSFRYGLDPTSKSSLALTAAGLATLQNAGRYDGPQVERAVREMWAEIMERESGAERVDSGFPHYERLYVALALWTHSDRRLFERWFEFERAQVQQEQRPDGSWQDGQFGNCLATSMNCLFLSINDGLLPLFER
ncbi:MAG: terpene cyclase/mutase family protein [Planctomycetes bacterium]|nr:terpene cyclase/mutase family protein [Planctomycetota bacterium]